MMIERDNYGIIGQPYPNGVEGGDSANWQGHHIFLTNDEENFPYTKTFEVSWGGYVRHPHPHPKFNRYGWYYENPWNGNITRDQLTGIMAALIRKKDRAAILRVIVHHMAFLMLFSYANKQNGVDPYKAPWKIGDPTGPDVWAMYMRGFGLLSWVFWPLLCVCDLQLLVSTVLVNNSKKDDHISYTMKMLIAKEFAPTPVGWLARRILDKKSLLRKLNDYWCIWRNCGMYKLYVKPVKDL